MPHTLSARTSVPDEGYRVYHPGRSRGGPVGGVVIAGLRGDQCARPEPHRSFSTESPVPRSGAVRTPTSTEAIAGASAVFRGFGPASLPTATTRDRGRLSLIASIGLEALGVNGDPDVGQQRLQVHLVRGQSHQQRTRETSWTGRGQAPGCRGRQLLRHLLAAGLQPGDDVGVLGGHVVLLPRVVLQVEQARRPGPEPGRGMAPRLRAGGGRGDVGLGEAGRSGRGAGRS